MKREKKKKGKEYSMEKGIYPSPYYTSFPSFFSTSFSPSGENEVLRRAIM